MSKLYFFYSNIIVKKYFLPFAFRALRRFFKMFGIFAKSSLSQHAEDIIIDIMLKRGRKNNGVFVDVGCNHPIEYNNTYLLYLRGWRGINIDGNKKLVDLHKQMRSADTSLNYLISNEEKELTFYVSTSDKLSTLNPDEVKKNPAKYRAEDQVKVQSKKLTSILDEHLPAGKEIDLLCIDVEGHEIPVISSLDFHKYRPYLLVIESHDLTIENHSRHELFRMLDSHNYKLEYFVLSTCYFIRRD